jgi:hypothetical protein
MRLPMGEDIFIGHLLHAASEREEEQAISDI